MRKSVTLALIIIISIAIAFWTLRRGVEPEEYEGGGFWGIRNTVCICGSLSAITDFVVQFNFWLPRLRSLELYTDS